MKENYEEELERGDNIHLLQKKEKKKRNYNISFFIFFISSIVLFIFIIYNQIQIKSEIKKEKSENQKELNALKEKFEKLKIKNSEENEKVYKSISENVFMIKEETQKLNEKITKEMTDIKENEKKLKNEILNEINENNSLKNLFGDSKIIKKDEVKNIKKEIERYNGNINTKKTKLLYRASENEYSAKKFHENCDGHENIIVFVKTENFLRFGGFTHGPFSSEGNIKNAKSTFLFDLNKKEIKYIDYGGCYNPRDGYGEIQCFPNQGPSFSFAFTINDYCNKKNGGGGSPEFLEEFKDSRNFEILEYEVYKINFN